MPLLLYIVPYKILIDYYFLFALNIVLFDRQNG